MNGKELRMHSSRWIESLQFTVCTVERGTFTLSHLTREFIKVLLGVLSLTSDRLARSGWLFEICYTFFTFEL